MKKLITGAVLLAIFGFFGVASAFASAKFNDSSAPGDPDSPTILIRNKTQAGPCTTNCVYHPSISANPGDIVTIQIFYHNTSETEAAVGTRVKLSQPNTSAKNFTFSGDVRASNASPSYGSANVSITGTMNQTLLFMPGTVFWYSEKPLNQNSLLGPESDLFTSNGLAIGTVQPWGTCTVPGPYYHDSFCHRGFVTAQFQVSSSVQFDSCDNLPGIQNGVPNGYYQSGTSCFPIQQTLTCSINNFYSAPQNVAYNGYATLHWTTTNCNNVSISGISGSFSANSYHSTGNLTSDTTFTLTAYGTSNNDTSTTTVTVNPPQQSPLCVIDTFYATPQTVAYNGYATLHWTTTNCNNVAINGVNGSLSPDGTRPTGNLTTDTTYTLTAYGSSNNDVKYETVNVTPQNQPNSCVIDTFYASPQVVSYNGYATLHWNTTNCSSVSINNISGSLPVDGTKITSKLTNDITYTLTAHDNYGGVDYAYETITVSAQNQNSCVIDSFYAGDTNIESGDSTTLYWNTTNCNNVSISNISGSLSVDGSRSTGTLNNDKTFTLTAHDIYGGVQTATETVYVEDQNNDNCTIDDFYANDEDIDYGDNTTLYWETTDCDYVTISSIGSHMDANDHEDTDDLYYDKTYTIHAYGDDSDDTDTLTINVDGYQAPKYECNDGKDNDGDGKVDMGDIGCSSYYDDDEYNFVYVPPVPQPPVVQTHYIYTNNTTQTAVAVGEQLVELTIDSRYENVNAGDIIDYTVTYKNKTNNQTISDAMIQVLFPENVEFMKSQQGEYSIKDNTLTIMLGTLSPNEFGMIYMSGKVKQTAKTGDLLTTAATMAFKNKGNSSFTVIAYETNNVVHGGSGNLLGALALFGADGIMPTTLGGWLLLILVVMLLVYLGRKLFGKESNPQVIRTPYTAPARPYTPPTQTYSEHQPIATPPHDLPH